MYPTHSIQTVELLEQAYTNDLVNQDEVRTFESISER